MCNGVKIGDNHSGIGFENLSTLLHPVIRLTDPYEDNLIDTYFFAEDIFAEFTNKVYYYEKLKRLFYSCCKFNISTT